MRLIFYNLSYRTFLYKPNVQMSVPSNLKRVGGFLRQLLRLGVAPGLDPRQDLLIDERGRIAHRPRAFRPAAPIDRSPITVLRWIRAGVIPAEQYCKGAPWVIKRRDIEGQHLVLRAKMDRKAPASSDPDQHTLVFQ
jgi:hypothetical protein